MRAERVALILILLILGGFVFLKYYHVVVPPKEEEEGYILTRPLKIFVKDAITSEAITSGTLYIYDVDYNKFESVPIPSDGVVYSRRDYTSGQVLILYAESSGYYFKPTQIIVPRSTDKNIAHFQFDYAGYKAPSEADFGISVLDSTGAQVASETSGSTYNMTTTSATFTVHLVIPASTALINHFDPEEDVNGVEDQVLLWIKINDTLATLDIGTRVEYGGYVYYYLTLADLIAPETEPLTYDIAFTLNYGGTGALAIQVFIADNTDEQYFASALQADTDAILVDSTAVFYVI